MNIPDFVLSIISKIEDAGFEVYAVGGCVRDSLMGKVPMDWDLATSALPEEIQRIFEAEKVIPTGIKHGTVTVISQHNPVEITTFRIDGKYTDSRHPSNVTFSTDICQDLARRDFTINAMAYNPKIGLIDPFGGQSDLKHGMIRTVGNPTQRFSEDALRIMRAIRFSATLGFEIEEHTSAALFCCRHLLADVSVERITAELNKTLLAENPWPILTKYLPVLAKKLFGDEFDAKSIPFDNIGYIPPVLSQRLAVFIYDIARENLIVAQDFFTQLRYDTKTRHKVMTILENLNTKFLPDRVSIRKHSKRLGVDCLSDIMSVKSTLGHSVANSRTILDEIISSNDCCSLKQLDITGSDLKENFGLSGREIGSALDKLLDAVIEEKCENKKDTLLSYFKSVSKDIC